MYDYILPNYLYGCDSNLGDQTPEYRTYIGGEYDEDLVKFCKRDPSTVACTEFQVRMSKVFPPGYGGVQPFANVL